MRFSLSGLLSNYCFQSMNGIQYAVNVLLESEIGLDVYLRHISRSICVVMGFLQKYRNLFRLRRL